MTITIRKTYLLMLFIALFTGIQAASAQKSLIELIGRSPAPGHIDFKNAPVLLKEKGVQYQQLIVSYNAKKPGNIILSTGGKELLNAKLNKWNNRFLVNIPVVAKVKKISIAVKIDEEAAKKYNVVVEPVKKWSIYLVEHTHTDIGYTHAQSEVLAEQMRNIDYALDYCDQTDNMPDDAKFRWSCESAWITREYLRSRPASQIARLKKRIAEGRIEVTGMYFNMAELPDENLMYDFLQPLKELTSAGIPIKTAMQDDVNGVAWCLPDYFKNTGVKYLNMGINETRTILPFDKPTVFWWESPAGERLLAYRSDHYLAGNFLKIGTPAFNETLLWYLADLQKRNYPLDRTAIPFSGYFADNSPPSINVSQLVKEWNEKYDSPKLRLSIVSEFLEYAEKNYGKQLPVYRKAWLDWWSDGFGSASRETAEIRKIQNLKSAGEGVFAMSTIMGEKLNPALQQKVDHVSENALFFDEHTVGADQSISHPFSENTNRQWLQKGAYAWEALKRVTLLNDEAMARLQGYLKKADFPLIYVVNPMGWQRSGTVEIFLEYKVCPVEKSSIIDIATGKAIAAQVIKRRPEGAYWAIEVTDVPALGYKTFKVEKAEEKAPATSKTDAETIENDFYKIKIDKATGSISRLYDKQLNQELVDNTNKWKLGQPVRETLTKRDTMPPSYSTVSNVKIGTPTNGPLWESISVAYDMAGFQKGEQGNPKGLELEIRLYKNVKKIEFKYSVLKETVIDPEALYIAFPFILPNSKIVFETIGGTLSQGQQLPGSSSDWNVAQSFVSVRSKKAQIIMVSNEVPLWQFSDFNIGKLERYPKPGKPWLYSWVMNNYWFTNFRASQEGGFSWTYQLTSTADTTNAYATRYAWGARNPFMPLVVLPGNTSGFTTPAMSTLKIDGPANALLVNSRPVFKGKETILLHFRELEGLPAEVKVSSLVKGRPVKSMTEVNAIGKQMGKPLNSIQLKPFEVRFIEVEF